MRCSIRASVVVAVAVVAPASSAQVSFARGALRAELVGCYELRPGAGNTLYNAPPGVRLDSTETVRSGGSVFRVLTPLDRTGHPTPVRAPGPGVANWSADSLTDSVRLSFGNGFSGAVFVFAAPVARFDTLLGRAHNQWDFGPPFETDERPARAIRRRCAPVPNGPTSGLLPPAGSGAIVAGQHVNHGAFGARR